MFDSNMKVDREKADARMISGKEITLCLPELNIVCGDIEFPENQQDSIRNLF
ncbi:MAG: hypothetical protein R2941_18585 [Desulfobacterales bacterium]